MRHLWGLSAVTGIGRLTCIIILREDMSIMANFTAANSGTTGKKAAIILAFIRNGMLHTLFIFWVTAWEGSPCGSCSPYWRKAMWQSDRILPTRHSLTEA